jgi:Fe-S oxidoreductase
MTKANRLAAWQANAQALSSGRTLDEQIDSIKKYGNHGVSSVLRAGVLSAHGIARPKDQAKNCIIFGCYRPFSTPFLVRDYIRLLDILSIDYTYLDQEYCCGNPLTMTASREQRDNVLNISREFIELNLNQAQQKGATKLAYCCAGCVHVAKDAFIETSDSHVYIVDLILDSLETQQLKVIPINIGYFKGCHTFFRSIYPKAKLDWARYRQRLSKIEGLSIVDLPNDMCCKTSAEKIIECAEKMNLNKILCSCNWCSSSLMQVAKGRVQMISLPELLLQSLQ